MNKHKIVVIVISLLNVIIAIGKDSFLAGYLGTTGTADAFFMAFFIPDMLGNNLLAAAFGITAAPFLVKVFAGEAHSDFKGVFLSLQRFALGIAVSFTVIILIFGRYIIATLGAGFDTQTSQLALLLLYVLCPTISFYPVVSIRVMTLQVKGKFGLASMTALFPNVILMALVFVLSLLNVPKTEGVYWLVGGIVMAVVLQISYLNYLLHGVWQIHEVGSDAENHLPKDRKKIFVKPFLSVVVLLFLSQGLLYYERYLGSKMAAGSIAAISYAFRISQFSILVFGYSIAFVIYPKLIEFVDKEKFEEAAKLYQESVRQLLMLSIPVAIGLCVLREPVIRILFEHYSFDNSSVEMSAEVLFGYGISVIGQGLVFMNLRLLAAFKRLRSQVIGMGLIVLITMGIERLLVMWFGLAGIGYGTLIGSFAGAFLTTAFITLRLKIDINNELWHIGRIFIGNIPALVVALILNMYWHFQYLERSPLLTVLFGTVSGVLILGTSFIGVNGFCRIARGGVSDE